MKVAQLAVVKVKDGQGPVFEAMFAAAKTLVEAHEPGTLLYQITRSREDPNVYTTIELFEDAGAHKAHGQVEGFAAVFADLGSHLAEPPKIEQLDVLA